MKAIVHGDTTLPASDPRALQDAVLPDPTPEAHDLLVEVRAVSVNPVDTKVRQGLVQRESKVLGWDVSGVVRAVGSAVSRFAVGDEVYYAGELFRPGCNSELHLVDEYLAGHKPKRLDHAQAAALPLTAITAWELLFDRLGATEGGGAGQQLLVMGAAGGVGSVLVQLARQLTELTVIGTASRQETQDWVRQLGAHHVIDHHQPLRPQLEALGLDGVTLVASLTHTDEHFTQLVDVLRPQGRLGVIDDPAQLDVVPMKAKSLSLHWELMFTRSLFQTPDKVRQHEILERVAGLIDQGTLKTTLGEHLGRIDAANLRRAHAQLESHQARGKLVLEGF